MRYYEYIYYRTYQNAHKDGSSINSTKFSASLMMSFYFMLNLLSVSLLLMIFDVVNIFLLSNKLYAVGLGMLVLFIVNLVFLHLNRNNRIIEYFSTVDKSDLSRYEIVYWIYRILSFVFPLGLMYLI